MAIEINRVAVLGSGVMGTGIAGLLASAGLEVELLDIVPKYTDKDAAQGVKEDSPAFRNKLATEAIQKALKAKQSPFMVPEDAERVRPGNFDDHMERVKDCDWIIEVVVENLEIKKKVFEKVAQYWNGKAVLSTNTSGIPIKDIAEALKPEMRKYFLGTHFFNPPRFMHLLEIIPGKDTKKEIVKDMAEFCEKVLGKGVVYAKDTPNFVGNRIGVAGMISAMHKMLEMGLTIDEVDQIMGPPMGRPRSAMFKTADLVGLDTLVHIAHNTAKMVDKDEAEKFFKLPEFVEKMVEKGMLGDKSNGGFYTKADKKKRLVINPQTLEYEEPKGEKFQSIGLAAFETDPGKRIAKIVNMDDRAGKFAWAVFAESSIYAAERVPEIADSIVEIDNAMKWGYNFDLGPFETWDAVGLKQSVERMKKEGYKIPKKIKEMLEEGAESFYRKNKKGELQAWDFKEKKYKTVSVHPDIIILKDVKQNKKKVVETCPTATLLDIGDGVFLVEFHSPMNSLDMDMWAMMRKAVDRAIAEGVGVVIGNQMPGMPGAFSAGANISVVLQAAKNKQWDQIREAVKYFQETNLYMTYSKVPVVAAPYGLTLGGGAEVAMACNKMVCHADLFMGMVEVGVGLIPAGCGCMMLLKRYQNFIPKRVEINNLQPFVTSLFQMIATAAVSSSAADAKKMGFLTPCDKIIFNQRMLIGQAKKEVIAMAQTGFTPPKPEKIQVLGEQLRGIANAFLFDMKCGGYVSDYDVFIAKKLAKVLGGGSAPENGFVDESVIVELEREVFVELCHEEKTQQRLEHMLLTGKPLRN